MGGIDDPHPSSTGHNRSQLPIDCCVSCFGGIWVPLGEAEPPKAPESGTPTTPFRPKIGCTEVNLAQWFVVAAKPVADGYMRAGFGWLGVVEAI